MSLPPRHPLDDPPGSTPELLQRDLDLDRRTRPGLDVAPTRRPSPIPEQTQLVQAARPVPPSPAGWTQPPGPVGPRGSATEPPGLARITRPAPARSAPAHPHPQAAALPAHLLVTQPGVMVSPVPRAVVPDPVAAPAPVERDPRTVRARPAGLLRRLAAWMVDLGLISGVCATFLTGAMLVIAPRDLGLVKGLLAVALPAALLLSVLAFVYGSLFGFLFQGRTPGRALLGLRLVNEQGTAPGPGRALARAALALVSFGLFLSGFWLALFDRRGQTLHDKLTRTFVVRLLDV